MALGFGVLVMTGAMLFLIAHSNHTAAIHTTFAALFVIAAAFHVRNNAKALAGHAIKKRAPPMIAFSVVGVVLAAGVLRLPGADALYDWGNAWRSQQRNTRETTQRFEFLTTHPIPGATLELTAMKGRAFQYPLFAVWIEDAAGSVETLYVSQSVATNRFGDKAIERPEALPVWAHRRAGAIDAVSGATPVENWHLTTHTAARHFTLYLEVNQSFDWNDYYSKTRFPDDPVYSGSGQVGQPSIVYAAELDPSRTYFALEPIGHGHHSGKTGDIDRDLSKITTALEILDGVMVKYSRVD